jgi:hypothetical protein
LLVSIPPQGYGELEQIAKHASRLGDVLKVTATHAAHVPMSVVTRSVEEKTGLDSAAASALISGLSNLRVLMDQVDVTPEQLLEAVTASVELDAPASWAGEQLEAWQNATDTVAAALRSMHQDHPLLVRQKARELTFAHQNIFKKSRIITDLRPVFNAAGDEITTTVLTHVLSIEFFDGRRTRHIQFAMDEGDVVALQKATDRALTKTAAVRKKYRGESWGLIVAGDAPTSD